MAPWLEGATGKVIRYRTTRKDPDGGELHEVVRETRSIKTAFKACLIEAGLCFQARDAKGKRVWIEEPAAGRPGRPLLKPRGSENTIRHTVSTELHRRGVPDAQIDSAAGHDGNGTNKKNYRHLRPDYLRELIEAVEDFWRQVDRFTSVHRKPR